MKREIKHYIFMFAIVFFVYTESPEVSAKANIYTIDISIIDEDDKDDDDENRDDYLVERICIEGYVYINIYQRKPVMTIKYGNSTAITKFPVLQSTTQSFIRLNDKSLPQTCKND